jgi:tetrahydromethanopterin S-methyltransferase subunit F
MILYLVFGAIGFLAAGFTGVAIGIIVAFVVEVILWAMK